MKKLIKLVLSAHSVFGQQNQNGQSNLNVDLDEYEKIYEYIFESSHDITEHDVVYSSDLMSDHQRKGIIQEQSTSSTRSSFCSVRSDFLYSSTSISIQNCYPALKLTGGLDRSLQINKQLGNVNHPNLTRHKHFWQQNETDGHKWKNEGQKLKDQKSESEKMIEEEQKRITLRNKNVTQDVIPYTLFNNCKSNQSMKSSRKEDTAEWILNMTSIGYGNYSQPAIIDALFPYLQLSPFQFNATLLQTLTDVGFKQVAKTDQILNGPSDQSSKRVVYQIDQKCKVLLGCFQTQQFILSGVKPQDHIDNAQNDSRIEFKMNPLDYMIQTYSSNGAPQCTFGISTCQSNDTLNCPTILGATFLKSFDTILDYESNQIMMRTTPKIRYHESEKLCWKIEQKVEPKSVLDQFFDGMKEYENNISYWSNPANIYHEMTLKQNLKWLKYAEFTAEFFAVIILAAIAFAIFTFGMIEAEYHLYKLSEHYKLIDLENKLIDLVHKFKISK